MVSKSYSTILLSACFQFCIDNSVSLQNTMELTNGRVVETVKSVLTQVLVPSVDQICTQLFHQVNTLNQPRITVKPHSLPNHWIPQTFSWTRASATGYKSFWTKYDWPANVSVHLLRLSKLNWSKADNSHSTSSRRANNARPWTRSTTKNRQTPTYPTLNSQRWNLLTHCNLNSTLQKAVVKNVVHLTIYFWTIFTIWLLNSVPNWSFLSHRHCPTNYSLSSFLAFTTIHKQFSWSFP